MIQNESGNGKLPENQPVRQRKRRNGTAGQKKSDSDYNLDEGQKRQKSGRKRPEGTNGGSRTDLRRKKKKQDDPEKSEGARKERRSGREQRGEWYFSPSSWLLH